MASGFPNFWTLCKVLNITESKTQLPHNIIEYSNLRKFKYDDYLTIFKFKLLLYVVRVNAWLDEHCRFFHLK